MKINAHSISRPANARKSSTRARRRTIAAADVPMTHTGTTSLTPHGAVPQSLSLSSTSECIRRSRDAAKRAHRGLCTLRYRPRARLVRSATRVTVFAERLQVKLTRRRVTIAFRDSVRVLIVQLWSVFMN
ncbi:unnamed protein product [Trichogramma brassicae]|uniref:Uncharacterized protein n=1 Tax=Trichogramma brassicae TaxID=86971 RepID=A0A6H5IXU6_9HYME|nr:unnamed protein product [Trichogramma brassicae]